MPISYVNKEHRGTYYCVAENGVGRGARRNIAVEVQFAPVVNATRKRVGQALQFDMDLECKVQLNENTSSLKNLITRRCTC